MSWNATILNSVNNGLTTDVAVSFTNGVSTFSTTFQNISDTTLIPSMIADQILQLNTKDSKPITTGLVTVASVPAQTQADIDRNTFLTNIQKLQAMNRAIAAGVTIDATTLGNQKSLVNSQYLPAYLAFI